MGSVDTKPQMTVKWVRAIDGFVCFGVCVFLAVAVGQPFFLSSVVVTDIVNPAYSSIINSSTFNPRVIPDVCISTSEQTVSLTCDCLTMAAQNKTAAEICLVEHEGLPGEQIKVGRINPNFLLFYVFFVSALYQLVLRNPMGVDLNGPFNREVQVAVGLMCIVVITGCIMSLFQFNHGIDLFVLFNFMPQQIVLMLLSFVLYNNAQSADVTPDAKAMYSHAMFAGVYEIATLPMIALFVCCVNSWTTTKMLYFMYNTSMLLAVVQLAYHCVYIDSSQISPNPAAKIRMRQALYLLLTSVLTCLTVISFIYLPMHDNGLNRFLAIAFIVVLWVLHVLFDATNGGSNLYLYERSFNIFDGVFAVVRYMLLLFVFYLVWGFDMNDSI